MRIAFIVGPFPSISQTFVLNQITGLIDLGHDVEIFAKRLENNPESVPEVTAYDLMAKTTYFGDQLESQRKETFSKWGPISRRLIKAFIKHPVAFNYLLMQSINKKSLKIFPKAIPFLGKGPYDFIHCHFGPNGAFAVKLRELGAIKGKIGTVFHGYDLSAFVNIKGRGIYTELFDKGDIFLPISRYWADYLILLGCPKKKIIVHRMGIETNRFCTHQKNTPTERIKILSVARLVEKKGIEFGIKAVAEIIDDFPGMQYEIIGDGPLKSKLSNLIENHGLEKKIVLRGWKSQIEVSEMFKAADILLAPSITGKDGDQEGIPVVIMEGMASGLPVVSTFHSGISELVQDGVSGFLVEEKDTGAMAKKLRLLALDRERTQKMGLQGKHYVIEHYEVKKLNAQLSQIYQSLL